MPRIYTMRQRAEARDKVRERIVRATMQAHDEKGVAPTTFAEIAERAGVGPATVYRHFPTLGDLVRACGAHVWQEMRPPTPDIAASLFAGLPAERERLQRLVEELDGLYARGSLRLGLAARDRDLVPELDQFLNAVEAGIAALIREALAPEGAPDRAVQVVVALTGLPVWSALDRLALEPAELTELKVRLLACAIAAARRI